MIIEGLINLVMGLVNGVVSLLNLPSVEAFDTSVLGSVIGLFQSGWSIVSYFFATDLLIALLVASVAITVAFWLYDFVTGLFKDIGGMSPL